MFNWDSINKVSCLVTIGAPIVTFITGLKFYKIKRWFEYKRIKNNVLKEDSGVLIVSLGKNDIENQVRLWLKQKKGYKNIPDERIFKIQRIGNIISKDIDNIIKCLRDRKFKFQRKGIFNIHLFVAAPIVMCEIIGAEFKNDFTVFVYQYNPNSKNKYELWGKLQR
ncbi:MULTISPECIES: hypothetical protein [Clostridium]|uniref:Uncharacterized protein n=2 Tax=Clostridium botulinum TaxID=1491 RepID=B1IGS5_CLOBK|nr:MULTISPECIES: hypothetical protein [Clostridium]AJD28252.1 hypothetical protein T257_3278 [Clostridium botulinum CDC_297]EKX79813.1 hypothetical protein CFSAN001628_009913 [Clostridium botulinum CFSAN001628]EPS52115.1 hypothetical protein CFSAN002368_11626 [Clostridium botulinum A1 str. CFSAN002368]ACA43482.1 hypothetical protein CLD_2402 [Clostridium botulinum B1 str. Okra]MBD5564005.1 hypothetical protein [Clostridium botulinum]